MMATGAGEKSKIQTLTRAGLACAVQRKTGCAPDDAAAFVEDILRHVSDALANSENVKISNFGSFILRDKPERIGRNPKTRVEVMIPPLRALLFHPSRGLRQRIAKVD